MIDTLRKQIQERLDQLLSEAESFERTHSPRWTPVADSSAPARATASRPRPAAAREGAPQRTRSKRRTAPGATKARVLGALSGGKAMTAGEVAAATGVARATVSTTLSKLAKSGDVVKAERGYRLP